jgi:hypothetical protein
MQGGISHKIVGRTTRGIVTDGLVLHLDAGNPESYPGTGTTWNDLSGNGNNGTLVNGVGYSGDNGGSLVFDGVNDIIDVQHSSVYKPNFPITISSFFKINQFSLSLFWIIRTDNPTNGWHSGVDILVTPTAIQSSFGNNTQNNVPGRRTYASSTALSTNVWYNLIAVLPNSTTCLMYLNGQNISCSYLSGTATTLVYAGSPAAIGYRYDSGGQSWFFNGNIAQASIYDKALTAQEVQQNFNALRHRYGI